MNFWMVEEAIRPKIWNKTILVIILESKWVLYNIGKMWATFRGVGYKWMAYAKKYFDSKMAAIFVTVSWFEMDTNMLGTC